MYVGILNQSLTEYLSRLTKRLRSEPRMRVDTRKRQTIREVLEEEDGGAAKEGGEANASALDHSDRTCGCSHRGGRARFDLLATGRKNVGPVGGEASLPRSEKRRRAWQV